MAMWTGLVTHGFAQRVMGSVAVAGGFVAVDLHQQNDDGEYFAAIPEGMPHPARASMPIDEFRKQLIAANRFAAYVDGDKEASELLSAKRLRDETATIAADSRISNLLAKLTVSAEA